MQRAAALTLRRVLLPACRQPHGAAAATNVLLRVLPLLQEPPAEELAPAAEPEPESAEGAADHWAGQCATGAADQLHCVKCCAVPLPACLCSASHTPLSGSPPLNRFPTPPHLSAPCGRRPGGGGARCQRGAGGGGGSGALPAGGRGRRRSCGRCGHSHRQQGKGDSMQDAHTGWPIACSLDAACCMGPLSAGHSVL